MDKLLMTVKSIQQTYIISLVYSKTSLKRPLKKKATQKEDR